MHEFSITVQLSDTQVRLVFQGRIQGCPDTCPLLRVPFLDYRNSIASKIDATHVIKAHSIVQFVMP